MKRIKRKRHSGIILLVVLSMLTFFSLLVAAYLVFATQSEKTSYVLATRTIKQPDPNAFIEEALMTLIRGTNDVNHPFYGEDLLSDYYGRKDSLALQVGSGLTPTEAGGFITFRSVVDTSASSVFANEAWEDIYAGRIITFTSGDLINQTFRVIRSAPDTSTTPPTFHDFVIQAKNGILASDIATNDKIRMNGVPRNSPGLGYDASVAVPGHKVRQTTSATNLQQPSNPGAVVGGSNPAIGFDLPVSFQPNHLGRNVDKSALLGDFDEEYDAADYYNWFLSYRDPSTGKMIPSFHRPAVINYIANAVQDWSGASVSDFANVTASLARGTMRPLPIAAGQFGSGLPQVMNQRFTGGNKSYPLQAPLLINNANRLDQLVNTLAGDDVNAYDVDNNFDGVTDSVWIDLDLPVFSSPEGKLLKPLVAPMIEDLSGRLNVNAHGNFALINQSTMLTSYNGQFATGTATPFRLFNGRGFGPAEINFPGASAAQLSAIFEARYSSAAVGTDNIPGKVGADAFSILTGRFWPAKLNMMSGYRNSVDPYGRGGSGISAAGNLISVNVGTDVTTPITTNEAVNHPYEMDPNGKLSGDSPFTASELEPILRVNEYDTDLLPTRLLDLAYPLISSNMEFTRALTTISKSDDSPASMDPSAPSAYASFARIINGTLANAELKKLIAPELRLGRKLDVNRPLGNGIDDNANNVIDDPSEDESSAAFRSLAGATIHSNFSGATPDYNFEEPATVSARQLLARHLYVLMMTISRELDSSTTAKSFATYGDTLSPAVPVSSRERYRARRLAQWAVNVVDYRDPDSILTAFEYDENPFDGWGVDGNLLTTTEPNRGVVWGVENPELVFTESASFHDVRVRDTTIDSSGKKKGDDPMDDEDTDQVRIPQGSTFFELYATRERLAASSGSPWIAGIPQELYDVADNGTAVDYALDLSRTVTTHFDDQGDANPANDVYGDTSDPTFEVPVWRIAISEPHFDPPAAPAVLSSPLTLRDTLPDTLSFEPSRMDELGVASNTLALQRFVFFNHFGSAAAMQNAITPLTDITSPDRVYFNYQNRSTSLLPEQYLSLAPRVITYLGSKPYNTEPTGPSGQHFRIKSDAGETGLMQYDLAADPVTPANPLTFETVTINATNPPTAGTMARTQDGLALVIAGFSPGAWTTPLPQGIGLNISEPFASNYYAEPTQRYSTTIPGYPLTDAYVEVDAGGNAANGIPRGQPEDMRVNGPIRELTHHFSDPAAADPMLGTVENVRTAFLQRLADPTQGFHPVLNPYRTIDQIALDLTILSGEERPADVIKSAAAGAGNPGSIEVPYLIGSRQRDGVSIDGTGTNVLYSYNAPLPGTVANVNGAVNAYFEFAGATAHLQTTFNYLNNGFGTPQTGLNTGRPTTPFAMHPWLNRPFATPMELILVPACSQGRLFEEFSVVAAGVNPDIYPDADQASAIDNAERARLMIAPFRHLLNFFHSQDRRNFVQSTSPWSTAPTEFSSEFASLFDFVSTPPQFRGEIEAINPADITANANLSPLMSAPFNFLYDNIRTGTINLNTIANSLTWEGLMQGHLNSGEAGTPASQLSWSAFQRSRRGHDASGTTRAAVNETPNPAYNYDVNRFDPRYPTQFAGVFRQARNASHVPLVRDSVTTADADTTNGSDVDSLVRRPVNTTLLRGGGTLDVQEGRATSGTPTSTAMFVRNTAQQPVATAAPYADRNRHPFMRYETLMRMPNLVSDNSQVYLVRLTMGFFEVDANNTNDLGAEYNEQIGQQKRYHAMFIIDRSIPVGFVPGRDLNARDTVIFERFFQ